MKLALELTLNPPPISPITFSTGTGTLSKDSSQAEKVAALKHKWHENGPASIKLPLSVDERLTVGSPDAQFVLRLAAGDPSKSSLHDECRYLVFLHTIYFHLSPGEHGHDVRHASVWNPDLTTWFKSGALVRGWGEDWIKTWWKRFLSPWSRWSGNVFHLQRGLHGSEWRLRHCHCNGQAECQWSKDSYMLRHMA